MTLDDGLAEAIKSDYTTAELSVQECAMLDYVRQLTRDATRLGPADLDALRAVGFSDEAILQITMIASWFNYINRMADGLGVGRDAEPDT